MLWYILCQQCNTQSQDWRFMTVPYISFCSFWIFFQFLFPGNSQQVQFLCLLIHTAAREGAQQFIEMIFSTSAGRLVFDAYKDSQPLPEVVARDHGHNKTACYLEGVTKRYIICRLRFRNLVMISLQWGLYFSGTACIQATFSVNFITWHQGKRGGWR